MAALAASLLVAAVAAAQENIEGGHEASEPGRVHIADLPVESRQRVHHLWSELVCACPDENWSKSLANCPDRCADAQKAEVVVAVAAGSSDEDVLAAQVARYGSKVLGSQPTAFLVPIVLALGGAGVLVFVYRRWRRASGVAAGEAAAAATSLRPEEIAAVERELGEIR